MVTAEIQHKTQKGEELKQRFVYVWRSRGGGRDAGFVRLGILLAFLLSMSVLGHSKM